MGVAGWFCWQATPGDTTAKYAVFAFVFIGWIASLCVHEFSHARTALWGGDRSVIGRGYLTLNPLKYLSPGLSIIMPLVFLAIGGLGLPGGAVWINQAAIRDKRQRSLMSLAGPGSNVAMGMALGSIIKIMGLGEDNHVVFGSAMSYLTGLQFIAAILNMLPIPGLDGFGAIEPFLKPATLVKLAPVRQYGFFILLILSIRVPAFSELIFGNADRLSVLFGVPKLSGILDGYNLADVGRQFFRDVIPNSPFTA
jgi:Zn-dependent protease